MNGVLPCTSIVSHGDFPPLHVGVMHPIQSERLARFEGSDVVIGAYDAVPHDAIPRVYAACTLSESVLKRTGRISLRWMGGGVGEKILVRCWMLS